MDLLEKNMVIETSESLLNYGELDETTHKLEGTIKSQTPFMFSLLGDGVVLDQRNSENVGSEHRIQYDFVFDTPHIYKFQLKLEKSIESNTVIRLKLWKPYPISPLLPNE